jgi:uncharacterized protein YaiL (DUF2058 family)
MSIGSTAIGEVPIGAQPSTATTSKSKTPAKRRITAKADVIDSPEAR